LRRADLSLWRGKYAGIPILFLSLGRGRPNANGVGTAG